MKLKDDFFRIKDSCQTATGFNRIVELNPEHFIYRAHFPESPVTPSVCIIQIIKELLEDALQCKFFLKKIHNAKFLNVINPLENREVAFSISILSKEEGVHKISAVVFNNDVIFAKLSMFFINEQN
jgi:3-hydroxyacyl-[acyl-carrier-protein] dehydratase